MVSLTLYGGVNEVGGNKLLVEGREARLFLDFGVSFSVKRKYYSGFIRAKRFRMLEEYFLTGVLPRLDGVYRGDLHAKGKGMEEPSIDACIVSHAHLDHCGHVSLLRPDIPIYAGRTASLLMEAREEIKTSKSPEDQIVFYRDYVERSIQRRDLRKFSTGEDFHVKDITIHPIHVDHSVPASYAFILECGGVSIAYTGDFRLHGPMGWMTEDFIREASKMDVDVLLVEGTRMDDLEIHSEESVKQELANLLKNLHGRSVTALIGLLDFDRLMSFLHAAEVSGRKLLLSPKIAYILSTLSRRAERIDAPKLSDDRISVYMEPPSSGMQGSREEYRGWLRSFIEECTDSGIELVSSQELARNGNRYVFTLCQAEDIPEIIHIEPESGSILFLSTSEPHNEEQEIEKEKIMNWVSLFGMRTIQLHASGHASQGEVINTVKEISPRAVVPIHTEHADMFKGLLERQGLMLEVLRPSMYQKVSME